MKLPARHYRHKPFFSLRNNKILIILGLAGLFVFFIMLKHKLFLWDGNESLTILIDNENPVLYSYIPQNRQLIKLNLPNNLFLELPGEYGYYQLSAVSNLSLIEKKPDLLTKTIQKNFAIPISGTIYVPPGIIEGPADLALSGLKNHQSLNLTSFDFLRLWWHLRTLKTAQVNDIDLDKTKAVFQDGEEGRIILNFSSVDEIMQKYFGNNYVQNENLTIQVFNGAGYPNLAQKLSRLLTNYGLKVVHLDNYPKIVKKSVLFGSEKIKISRTVVNLQKIYNLKWENDSQIERSDLILVVGEDLAKIF